MGEQVLISDDIAIPDVTDWVTEDDTPVDNFASEKQQRLLVSSLYSSLKEQVFLAAANVGIYHTAGQPAIVPDVFVSFDVQVPDNWWEKQHRCYLVWNFGKPPEIAIEIVSNQVGDELGDKYQIYEHMRVSYYVVYDPNQQLGEQTLYIYELRGRRYVELENHWLDQVGLGLTLWQGEFEERHDTWLRWYGSQGESTPDRERAIFLTGDEIAAQERQRAEQERQRAEQERQRAEQERQRADRAEQVQRAAIAQLRAMGMAPQQIADTLGLSLPDVEQMTVRDS
ncbi:MAG: Uma2 family endonuclease [Cyanobacteriota bacterium SKYGB_h_bin112]|nr:Uma2 family endonuclease [Cyanobacteriota bacterium SKYGB_h_bin112]